MQKAVDWFKRLFQTIEKAEPTIKDVDPVLGNLKSDPRLVGNILATVAFEGRHIELSIDLDGEAREDCLELARSSFKQLNLLIQTTQPTE